jgi:hypothetical protein
LKLLMFILVNHKIEIRKEKSKDNEKIRTGKECTL